MGSFFLVYLCLIGGCSPKKTSAQHDKNVKKSTPANTASSSTKTSTSMFDGETYQIYYPTEVLSDHKGQQTIKIIPKPGYKVNQDFPHRLQVNPSTSIKVNTDKIDGKITQKQLHYYVAIEGQNGKHDLKAKADFSICNENMCKLYRAEDFKWTAQINKP